MIERDTKKKRELKGPSLTIKWAFASSFFIFVVFTIFAVITYKSSVNLIVEKERKNVVDVTSNVSSRLTSVDEELTTENVYHAMLTVENNHVSWSESETSIKNDTMVVDSFIAQLGQEPLDVYVYNLEGDVVFKNENDVVIPLEKQHDKEPVIKNVGEKIGYLSVIPIYSDDTGEKIGYVQAFYELSSFYDIRSKLLLTLIILEVVSLILSSILGFLLSAYFLKPIQVLRDTMEEISRDPQSVIHMPEINTNDELADLAEIFNDMLDRMRLYIERQEQFVEDVSHELRTPVAIIEGHLSMLNRWGKSDPDILEESLNASIQEISRMKSLVQEMLDLSRAEQSDMQYVNETSNAKEVIHQIVNNFRMLYKDYEINFTDHLEEEETVAIYRNHFEQIIIIILDNALKYSTDRKEVNVDMVSKDQQLVVAVQDYGEGIPEEDLKKIFNRFYRVDKARARTKGGNGLGLSIAKQLVDNYKGTIIAESTVGEGTTFIISLPIVTSK